MSLTTALCAVDPADNQIKGALYDIEKYEKQFGSQTSANPSSIKRSLRLLALTRQRLDGSANKSHTSWIDADKRYTALVTHMNNLANGGASASTSSTAAPQSSTPARQTTTRAPAQASAQPMISQYRVRIKKIQRDIASVWDTMDKGGIKPFQDPTYVQKFETSAQGFQESIAKYDQWKSDADVVLATQKLTELVNMIKFGKEYAAKELAELGEVQARLKQINQQIRQLKQPDTPEYPYGEGQLKAWITQLARVRQAATEVYAPLPEIKQRAYLPNSRVTVEQGGPYGLNDVDRLERALIDLTNSIDSNLEVFGRNLTAQLGQIEDGLAYYLEQDPADRNDQTNHFQGEGRADEVRARLARDKTIAEEAANYSQLLNDSNHSTRLALLQKIEQAANTYEANYLKARELVRMPKAATKDSNLTKIARETITSYDDVGKIERMVINTEKQHRTKETSDIEFDDADVSLSGTVTLSGTQTTYFYEWDQFQVATAEPKGDKYFIYYNTLKYFTSGSTTTPLNKWIMSGRLQGSEIPKENINKN